MEFGPVQPKKTAKVSFDRKDMAIMAIMTFLYLILALYNLGSTKVPVSGWKPSVAGEFFVADIGREVELSRIAYYCGFGDNRELSGNYMVEYMDASGAYIPMPLLEKKNIFVWQYMNVEGVKTSKLKISVESSGGALNELAFFERGSTTPLKDIRLLEIKTDPQDEGTPQQLFDEQDRVRYVSSFMDGMYFDEIYHARTAYEHIHRIEPYESTHPPLGKIFIAAGIAVFGMVPFGWRIVGTIFGAAMIPVMYAFGKKLFGKRFYAFCSAFLMMFDFMHFTQTRIATIDVYVTFFVILMFYYMYDYFNNKSYETGFIGSLKPLFLSGLFFGLGAASKWIALYGAAGLAFLIVFAKLVELGDYRRLARSDEAEAGWIKGYFAYNAGPAFLACCIFFIAIPAVIYLLSYIPFMLVPGTGHEVKDVFSYQLHMYNYHSTLKDPHPFSSTWWQWPIMLKPIWYYTASDMPAGRASTIVAMGNPAIWWAGIAAVLASAVVAIQKRDKKMVMVFTALVFQYIPWIVVSRVSFIYHFFSILPFMMLCIVYMLQYVAEKGRRGRYGVYAYLGLVALLFVAFYPAISGFEVGKAYIDALKWLPTWSF